MSGMKLRSRMSRMVVVLVGHLSFLALLSSLNPLKTEVLIPQMGELGKVVVSNRLVYCFSRCKRW